MDATVLYSFAGSKIEGENSGEKKKRRKNRGKRREGRKKKEPKKLIECYWISEELFAVSKI